MWVLAGLSALLLLFRRRIAKGPVMTTRITLAATLVASFAASCAQTIVIAALPAFAGEFGVSGTSATWALTAFMLASAVSTPIAGRLGDLFGYRRIALVCLGFFVVGTLLCALADSFPLLLTGRAVTGVSCGVFPLAFGLVRRAVPPGRLPGVVALLSAMFGIGGSAGMLVAAPLVACLGSAWLFWPLLFLGILGLLLAALLPPDEARTGGRVDFGGAALLAGALAALLLGISEAKAWGTAAAIALFAVAAALFAAFGVVELRTREPLVDLRVLGRRAVAAPNLITVVVAAAIFGVVTVIPRLVATDRLVLALLPMVLVMLVATPLSPRLGGRRSVRIGALFGIASCVLLVFAHDELWQVCVAGVLLGVGYGLTFAAFGTLVVEAVGARDTGVATGVNTIARTAGGAIGAQLAAVLITGGDYGPAFAVFGLIAVAALAVTSALPKRSPVVSAV